MSYDKPNYTQIPNRLLDVHMPQMKEAELKVTLAIARQTFGWQRDAKKLSIAQLQKLAGLSRQGVINGIEAGMGRGTITREESGQGFVYSLAVNEVDTQEPTSQPDRLALVNEVDQQLVNEVDPIKRKKERKLKKEKQLAATPPAPPPAPVEATPTTTDIIDAYVGVLHEHEPNVPVSYGRVGVTAKGLVKAGWTPSQVKEAYCHLKKQDFWKRKHLSLQSVATQIGAIHAKRKPVVVNQGYHVDSKPVDISSITF